mmetsp:Transcript_12060/g.25463  ORF Transcript_12060/g.25463 Transcript_12060/m.25463 type:complete len:730 (-) Transcript_12060:271-2460(-)|eukprot:CAMPEP_0171420010 /NCGR_PEP_ID=MMETSP0880-20121228/41900_1 /TAXON_ID=67004 /ORGANISM="Thalassiosira weissflogii, Strain CCMP1336" /LENGTH=729 /DNA_ID=CAMNT_0011938299 /DNA_START=17 /DNA_END=2206 /DNA_ORIENTATION=+
MADSSKENASAIATNLSGTKAPRKPLSSYSLFFRLERSYIYQIVLGNTDNNVPPPEDRFDPDNPTFDYNGPPFPERYRNVILHKHFNLPTDPDELWNGRKRQHRKVDGALPFKELSKIIAKNWKEVGPEVIQYCEAVAEVSKVIYEKQLSVRSLEDINAETILEKSASAYSAYSAPSNDNNADTEAVSLRPRIGSTDFQANTRMPQPKFGSTATKQCMAQNLMNVKDVNTDIYIPSSAATATANETPAIQPELVFLPNSISIGSINVRHPRQHQYQPIRDNTSFNEGNYFATRETNAVLSRSYSQYHRYKMALRQYDQDYNDDHSLPRQNHHQWQHQMPQSQMHATHQMSHFNYQTHQCLNREQLQTKPIHNGNFSRFHVDGFQSRLNRYFHDSPGKAQARDQQNVNNADSTSRSSQALGNTNNLEENAVSIPEIDPPSRFNIFCQLERQYIMQRELDAPPSTLGEASQFDPIREGLGNLEIPKRYRGLFIPSNFYDQYPNHSLEEAMHFKFERMSGIKCSYDISVCLGRRWRSGVDHETMDFCDKLHNILSLRMNETYHKGQHSGVSWFNFKRQQEGESRSDDIKRVCWDPNIMEHIDSLLHLRSGLESTPTQRTINGGVATQDEQTNQEVTDDFISNKRRAQEEHHDSNTPSKSSAAGNCDISTTSYSENAVPDVVESSGCEFSNSSHHDLEKRLDAESDEFLNMVYGENSAAKIDAVKNILRRSKF